MEEIKKFWTESMEIPEARWIVSLAGLVICAAMAYYIIRLFRDMAIGGGRSEPSSFISEFQQMRNEGMLEEEEFEQLAKVAPLPIGGDRPDGSIANRETTENTNHDQQNNQTDDVPDFVPDESENSTDENQA